MKHLALVLGSLIGMLSSLVAQEYDVLIGTYTESGKSEGIYVYTFNAETGALKYKNKQTDIDNPSFLTHSSDLNKVFAVSEFGRGADSSGGVYAYQYDPVSGRFHLLNRKPSAGEGPCYISTDRGGNFVFAANYGSGSLGAIPLNDDGSLGNRIQKSQHKGTGPAPQQKHSRTHAVVLAPDEKFLFATDLGADRIWIYRYESNDPSPLKPKGNLKLAAGSGPRHLTFHPDGRFAYVIQEISGTITGFRYKDGALKQTQSISILPDGFKGNAAAADIHISADGRFLYASNRIDLNEITIFSIDAKTGVLTFKARVPSGGKMPRNFAIDPSGNWLLVANQDSDNISVFRRNGSTGLISPTGQSLSVGSPVCLDFLVPSEN